MKGWMRRIAAGAMVAMLTGCSVGAAQPSAAPLVDEATATGMARHALQGLNDGDYAAWSRDWSEALRAAIGERDFLAFRQSVLEGLGRYVAITGVSRSSRQPGTYRYTFTITFEKGSGSLAFGFAEGGTQIEGVFAN